MWVEVYQILWRYSPHMYNGLDVVGYTNVASHWCCMMSLLDQWTWCRFEVFLDEACSARNIRVWHDSVGCAVTKQIIWWIYECNLCQYMWYLWNTHYSIFRTCTYIPRRQTAICYLDQIRVLDQLFTSKGEADRANDAIQVGILATSRVSDLTGKFTITKVGIPQVISWW